MFVFIKSLCFLPNELQEYKRILSYASFWGRPCHFFDRDIPCNFYGFVKISYTLYHKLTGSQSFFVVFWNNSLFFIMKRAFFEFIWIIFQNPLFFSAFLLCQHTFSAFILRNSVICLTLPLLLFSHSRGRAFIRFPNVSHHQDKFISQKWNLPLDFINLPCYTVINRIQ